MTRAGTTVRAAGPDVAGLAAMVDLDLGSGTVTVAGDSRPVGLGPRQVGELSTWLYALLHAGNPRVFARESLLVDHDFQREIVARLEDPWLTVPVTTPTTPVAVPEHLRTVELHRVRLLVPVGPSQGGPGDDTSASSVAVPCSRPNLTPGFHMFVHDLRAMAPGAVQHRVYVGYHSAADAVDDWAGCIAELVSRQVSFRSKILSRRGAYPRHDAAVFYVGDELEAVLSVLHGRGVPVRAGAATGGSPLCASAGPGIGIAESPADPRAGGQERSFGEHRCRVLAEAVVAASSSGGSLVDELARACELAGVDADDVSRNATAGPQGGGRR